MYVCRCSQVQDPSVLRTSTTDAQLLTKDRASPRPRSLSFAKESTFRAISEELGCVLLLEGHVAEIVTISALPHGRCPPSRIRPNRCTYWKVSASDSAIFKGRSYARAAFEQLAWDNELLGTPLTVWNTTRIPCLKVSSPATKIGVLETSRKRFYASVVYDVAVGRYMVRCSESGTTIFRCPSNAV